MSDASFNDYMRRVGLSAKTRHVYMDLLDAAERRGVDPLDWLHTLVKQKAPIGTILPYRAAVKHKMIHEGHTEDDIETMLPRAKGARPNVTQPLTTKQLGEFQRAAAEVSDPAIRTLILLMPQTGMRLFELLRLKRTGLIEEESKAFFYVKGPRGDERKVPLNREARALMAAYLPQAPESKFMFCNENGGQLTPAAVNRQLKQVQQANPDIGRLRVSVLRATAVLLWLHYGGDPENIGLVLGHRRKVYINYWLNAYHSMQLNGVPFA